MPENSHEISISKPLTVERAMMLSCLLTAKWRRTKTYIEILANTPEKEGADIVSALCRAIACELDSMITALTMPPQGDRIGSFSFDVRHRLEAHGPPVDTYLIRIAMPRFHYLREREPGAGSGFSVARLSRLLFWSPRWRAPSARRVMDIAERGLPEVLWRHFHAWPIDPEAARQAAKQVIERAARASDVPDTPVSSWARFVDSMRIAP